MKGQRGLENSGVVPQTFFKIRFINFIFIYVCALQECLVPDEVRRGHGIP